MSNTPSRIIMIVYRLALVEDPALPLSLYLHAIQWQGLANCEVYDCVSSNPAAQKGRPLTRSLLTPERGSSMQSASSSQPPKLSTPAFTAKSAPPR